MKVSKIVCIGLILLGVSLMCGTWLYYSSKYDAMRDEAEKTKVEIYVSSEEASENKEGIVMSESEEVTEPTTDDMQFAEENGGVVDDMDIPSLCKITEYKNVIEIPSLDIKAPILQGTSSDILWVGVGMTDSSAEIGAYGSCVLAGHGRTGYRYVFTNLINIKLLSDVHLWDENGKEYVYTVVNTYTVDQNDETAMPVDDENPKWQELYLITCTEGGERRFFAKAVVLHNKEEYNEYMGWVDEQRYLDGRSAVEDYEIPGYYAYITSLGGQ